MEKVAYRKRSGMFVRLGTSDDLVIDEAIDYNPLFIDCKNTDIFMDIGANIGSVSKIASKYTKNIICYEPDEDNAEMAIRNIGEKAPVLKYAISNDGKPIKLYQAGSNKGKISTVRKSKDFKEVQSLPFKTQLKVFKPTLIKIDIEGGEYNIDLTNLQKKIKGLAIEIHKINGIEEMKNLYNILNKQFSYKLGDIPDGTNEWFHNRDCFMTIFLRNTK